MISIPTWLFILFIIFGSIGILFTILIILAYVLGGVVNKYDSK